MSDAGCELAERGHLLGLDKTRLGSLEVAKGCFSGVAGGTDLSFGAFALGDVAVNEDKAAIGHRVVTNFEDPVVWTRALERVVPPRILRANNRTENFHQVVRRRERNMQRFKPRGRIHVLRNQRQEAEKVELSPINERGEHLRFS